MQAGISLPTVKCDAATRLAGDLPSDAIKHPDHMVNDRQSAVTTIQPIVRALTVVVCIATRRRDEVTPIVQSIAHASSLGSFKLVSCF